MALAVLVVMVISMVTKQLSASSCAPSHPQEKFCRADFVLRGRVLEEELTYFPETDMVSEKTYTVSVSKKGHIFKGELTCGNVTIITSGSDITSGVTMETEKEYVISGIALPDGTLLTTSCEFVVPYSMVNSHQRRGLRFKYKQGCPCKMRRCYGDDCSTMSDWSIDGDTCLWRHTNVFNPNDCYSKYTYCLNNTLGVCEWKSNRMFEDCVLDDSTRLTMKGEEIRV
ncbi:hypothetical protein FSP39_016265 [Pinctada imbricata]|uniref:NTR domain-containing protein n=1 Tax=Pinctada imbricata TaxID=66713 RepID=A0AA88YDY3_PINIB|nr:hypothetical protein FSP39_016265 [Pinctada imbricata]